MDNACNAHGALHSWCSISGQYILAIMMVIMTIMMWLVVMLMVMITMVIWVILGSVFLPIKQNLEIHSSLVIYMEEESWRVEALWASQGGRILLNLATQINEEGWKEERESCEWVAPRRQSLPRCTYHLISESRNCGREGEKDGVVCRAGLALSSS